MNTLISLFIFALIVATFFWCSNQADTAARFAMRLFGTIFAVLYLVVALIISWWVALIAFAVGITLLVMVALL